MSNYNFFERKLAGFLSKFPALKGEVKKLYQKINYLFYKKKYLSKTDFKITRISNGDDSSFFGYYDKSPINCTNEYVIFQSTNLDTSLMPSALTAIELILFNLATGEKIVIDQVYSYNWQQGCKLMWLSKERFIYNNYDNEKSCYVSKVYDVSKGLVKTIEQPIYDCYKEDFALTLNFERLNIGRGDYAYNNNNVEINWLENESDGLFYIDLSNGNSKLLVSISQAISLNRQQSMENAKHKFNHIMISPNGTKVMFMHRWFTDDNRRFDALLVCNIDGSDLRLVANDGMVSHCYWFDNESIFAYLRDATLGDKYFLLNIYSLDKSEVGSGIIDKFGDGHPSVYGSNILFDTYPNKSRMKHLLLFDVNSNELKELGEFYESFDFYAETRCDLHPRFSFDGKKVFFDSVHEGKRGLYMLELNS